MPHANAPTETTSDSTSKPSELFLADTNMFGEVLDKHGAVLLYHEDFLEDGIVGGIATREPFNICQLSLTDATKLRDALDVAIRANTPE